MEFPYGQPPPGHQHPTPVQPPMNVSQAPSASPAQQQTPTPTPAVPARQRKRPAPQSQPGAAPATPTVPTTPATQSATPQAATATTPAQPAGDEANTPLVNPPPAKKSRTNTPWTPAEELRLKQMRDAGSSWAEIAKVCSLLVANHFQSRSCDAVCERLLTRWPFVDFPNPYRGQREETLV
jgi:hypothetical protein